VIPAVLLILFSISPVSTQSPLELYKQTIEVCDVSYGERWVTWTFCGIDTEHLYGDTITVELEMGTFEGVGYHGVPRVNITFTNPVLGKSKRIEDYEVRGRDTFTVDVPVEYVGDNGEFLVTVEGMGYSGRSTGMDVESLLDTIGKVSTWFTRTYGIWESHGEGIVSRVTTFFKIRFLGAQTDYPLNPANTSISCFSGCHESEKTEVILWKKRRFLTWNDFQGVSDEDDERLASTAYGIDFNWDCDRYDNFTFRVQAYVSPTESWVKPEGKNSSRLLLHEQGHFDLAEIYSQKLREELKKMNCDNTTEEIDAVYYRIWEELDAEQNKYDKETDHGRNEDKQKEWNEKIERLLAEAKWK
jgi:hypothetical protein